MGKKALTSKQIKRIVYLRERGYSLPEIRGKTGHSNGTVFKYIRNVAILPAYRAVFLDKRKSSVYRMIQEERRALAQAKKLIKTPTQAHRILVACCLYWGEGTRGDFNLSNTDPSLIKTFVECLHDFGVSKKDLRVTIRVYEDIDIPMAVSFWAKNIGVPKSQILNVNVLRGKKQGKLKYGMCRVRVTKGGYLHKVIKQCISLISQKIVQPS